MSTLLILVLTYLNQDNKDFTNNPSYLIWQKCLTANNKIQCINENTLQAINNNPQNTNQIFSDFMKLRATNKITGDLRILMPTVHKAGMLLANKKINLPKAFEYCGYTFKAGCIHGYVMESIDHSYKKNDENFLKFCDQFFDNGEINNTQFYNCVHALGHELAAKSSSSLEKTLDKCNKIKIDNIDPCTSGVLMEFSSTGTLGQGYHSEEEPGKFDPDCNNLNKKYQSVCYSSYAYKQYLPGENSFESSYEFCQNIPPEYVPRCTLAIRERELLAEGKFL